MPEPMSDYELAKYNAKYFKKAAADKRAGQPVKDEKVGRRVSAKQYDKYAAKAGKQAKAAGKKLLKPIKVKSKRKTSPKPKQWK